MKKLIKFLAYFIASLMLLFAAFVVYSTLADYKPEPVENISELKGEVINIYDTLDIFDWNIGYSGLGDDMSFFYDGGEKMQTSKKRTIENLKGILQQIKNHDTIDFFLFQEVDLNSKRSYKIDEMESIVQILDNYNAFFALNYKVDFVPVPIENPMGKVKGGLLSCSKQQPYRVDRYAFPGNYAWPKGLYLLDRCFMVQRFYTSNGKELLIINTHNSAYDDGSIRAKQMQLMRDFLINEYKKGNYIVVGGDWNQNPPLAGKEIEKERKGRLTVMNITHNFLPSDWNWQFNLEIPTNRMIDEVYNPKTTVTTTIDFYLLSPNLVPVYQKNVDLEFRNSDHNPVLLSFSFLR